MSQLNPNGLKSIFGNYDKNFQANQYNSNQFPQNSQSYGFTYFNHSNRFSQNERLQIYLLKNIQQQNSEQKQNTIGFNHINNQFFQNSLKITSQQFKTILKKPHTFQINGFNIMKQSSAKIQEISNQISQHHSCRFQQKSERHYQQNHNSQNKSINNQFIKGLAVNHFKDQINHKVKLEQNQIRISQKERQLLTKNGLSSIQINQKNQNANKNDGGCIQNLKSLARVVFNTIKNEKITTYKTISEKLLQSLYQTVQFQQKTKVLSNQMMIPNQSTSQNHIDEEFENNKKNRIIQNMIQSKSFSRIKQIKDFNKRQIQNRENQICTNIKNIRRRLYDAINVMLAANIIEKKNKQCLALKIKIMSEKQPQNKNQSLQGEAKLQPSSNMGFEQLQNLIRKKQTQIDVKKKYQQILVTKYLTLQKHISKNIYEQVKHPYSNRQKVESVYFPLIFTRLPQPATIKIENRNQIVSINAHENIDIFCDLDILSYIYWIERQQIKKAEEQLLSKKEIESIFKLNQNGKKKNKQNQKIQNEVKIT